MFNFRGQTFEELAKNLQKEYISARPFPHLIIDNAIEVEYLNEVLNEFPDLSSQVGEGVSRQKSKYKTNNKFATSRGGKMLGEKARNLLHYLNSSEFIDFLQIITGLEESIIPDSHFLGGGYHEIKSGGFLKMHIDFSIHPETKLDRRLNLLLYLNKEWEEEYGGHFSLMDFKTKKITKKILPIFNRMVIFNTNDYTYHGHPDPLNISNHKSRKSLALYYYSNGRPESESQRNHNNKFDTIFIPRKGENIGFKYQTFKFIKRITPPFIFKLKNKLKNIN
tara:strand:+ start:363 stop:1199 length:837 start_codon:yes stop_codon:yes gene_type:complete